MPDEPNQSPHSAYGINYHLVKIPRYRKKILLDSVEASLKELLAEIVPQYGFERLAVEGIPEQVHWLESASPQFAPTEMLCLFKGIPLSWLKKEIESLQCKDWVKNAPF